MNVGSLFTGIGGFDLGLERAGMRVAWQCEQDEFCRRVLARHWPGVPCYPDVRELAVGAVEPVDVLCGGFPCQDISLAGRGAGIEGARSGLWSEYARLVRELRPRYVIVENVAALLSRGLGTVLGDLASCGYDAEWDCIPAAAVGAPHRRDRVWLVAYPCGSRRREDAGSAPGDEGPDEGWPTQDDHFAERDGQGGGARSVADPDSAARAGARGAAEAVSRPGTVERSGRRSGLRGDVGDSESDGRGSRRARGSDSAGAGEQEPVGSLQDADECALQPWRVGGRAAQASGSEWWAVEPPVGRVAHGVPDRLDQLAALGNALVPQIAEWLGTRILEREAVT